MSIRLAAPLALLSLAFAAPAYSTAPDEEPTEQQQAEKKEQPRKVCRSETRTGSNMPKRVCRTVAQNDDNAQTRPVQTTEQQNQFVSQNR